MLLSKTIIAVIVAATAGGIAVGSATTYVIAANKECVCKCEETRRSSLPQITEEELLEQMKAPFHEGGTHLDYKFKKP